ncbi:MAG: hypothetical protein ACI9JN_001285 [Bacteroidia bacterium]|jgi:hypothetical protein
MEYFINVNLTYKGTELAPHDIFNDPARSWVGLVEIDRQDGTKPQNQEFYGPTKEDAGSKALMFVNGLECNRALFELKEMFHGTNTIKLDQLLNTAK